MRKIALAVLLPLLVMLGPGAASALAADFSGTWTVHPTAGTPWSSGSSLTITPATAAAVRAIAGGHDFDSRCGITADSWYLVKYAWAGGGQLGGCVGHETATQLFAFDSSGTVNMNLDATGGNGTTLHGYWTNSGAFNPSNAITATKGGGSTSGGGSSGGGAQGGGSSSSSPGGSNGSAPAPTTSTATVATPPPDSTTIVKSAPLPDVSSLGIKLLDALNNLDGTTVVAPGERARKVGESVAACWLMGPDVFQFADAKKNAEFHQAMKLQQWKIDRFSADQQLTLCIQLARVIGAVNAGKTPPRTTMGIGGKTCHATRFALKETVQGGVITDAKLVASPPTATSPLYSCTIANGTMSMKLNGRSAKNLKAQVGTALQIGIYRSPKARATSAKLKVSFTS